MAETPNYGWRTPNNDSKVRAGALDIRLLGQDADATVYAVAGTVASLTGSVSSLDGVQTALVGSVSALASSVATLTANAVTLGEVIALGG